MKKRTLTILVFLSFVLALWAQGVSPLDQLKADPRKAYGTDYPYDHSPVTLTKAPTMVDEDKQDAPEYPGYAGGHARDNYGTQYKWAYNTYMPANFMPGVASAGFEPNSSSYFCIWRFSSAA